MLQMRVLEDVEEKKAVERLKEMRDQMREVQDKYDVM